ncbi:MAG: Hsp20/alpha crystallin family protein [Candidatus Lokiarchaeota archaeon]|nr:Hsp20/alpha crystallin family protein [Candidatus Lokiarchaeota archaeon]
MPDEDIFDYMNKNIKKMFKEWSFFGDEFDDMFQDVDEIFEFRSPRSKFSDDGKTKSYSISYKYQTGMKEPEIRVSGDATEQDVDRFLSGIQKRFGGHLIDLSEKKPLTLGLGEGEKPSDAEYKVPIMDVVEDNGSVELVLEMPGVAEKDLTVDIDGKEVIIIAEHDTIKYKRKISLNFEPKKKIKITENHGIVTIHLVKK